MRQDKLQSYVIQNSAGIRVELLNFGATVKSIELPAKKGLTNIALGYADIDDYIRDPFFMGATVGRYANRIGQSQFEISGKTFRLPRNDGDNHLHGGPIGFAKRYWQLIEHTESSVILRLLSEHGDQGYPGNLSVTASYRLESDMRLSVDYRATTDLDTPVNLSSHIYFNLNGVDQAAKQFSSIENHEIQIEADCYTPVDEAMLPTGEIATVSDTAFDFRVSRLISSALEESDQQLLLARGFDHNFVLRHRQNSISPCKCSDIAKVRSPESGIQMNVYTNKPGVQFYTGNFLAEPFDPRAGFCLETQHFPDAPNKAHFPSAVLEKGDTYLAKTIFEFDVTEQ